MFTSCFIACKKDGLRDSSNQSTEAFADDSHASKMYFARTLAAALEKEPALRTFIKEEALKMFDKDYDVLYHLVSDEKLRDGQTFYEKIAKYAQSKDSLNLAIEKLPLLTILVPEVPDFDAIKWKENEVPAVAVEPQNPMGENVKAFYGELESFDIPFGLIPCFPVLVVKDNERVGIEKSGTRYNKAASTNKLMAVHNEAPVQAKANFLTKRGVSYSFLDEVFNGIEMSKYVSSTENMFLVQSGVRPADPGTSTPLSKVKHIVDAMNSSSEWQRDFVYYGIDPAKGKNNGVLNRDIVECITQFRFAGPEGYNAITTPEDPRPVDNTQIPQQWTDGNYEFRVTVLINKKNGPGQQTQKTFYVKPSDLFNISYNKITPSTPCRNCTVPRVYAEPKIERAKTYRFPDPIRIDSWDLEQSSFGWKVSIVKFSNQQNITESFTHTVEFANNFEFSAQLGDKVKIGPKFGSSLKTTNAQNYSVVKTVGPSNLGEDNLYFDKPIWNSFRIFQSREGRDGPLIDMVKYEPYEIFTGSVYMVIEPRLDSNR